MKNVMKIFMGIFVSLIYIPLSLVASYTVISKLTNLFNAGYESVILNIIFGIIGLFILLALVIFLEKIIDKVIEKKIRFMIFCTVIPIIILCIGMIVLNFNFLNLKQDMAGIDIGELSQTKVLNVALMSLSSIFIVFAFFYLLVFVMYIIVHKLLEIKDKKKTKVITNN